MFFVVRRNVLLDINISSLYYILPHPKLITIVNQLRYINAYATKDMCSIPMEVAIVFGRHKLSLQVTIDHH